MDARGRAEEIRGHLGNAVDELEKVAQLVAEAWESQDWLALGHDNWGEYCAVEYGSQTARMTALARGVLTPALASAGVPTGAIAAVEGVDRKTVQRDLKPEEIVGDAAAKRWRQKQEAATNVAPAEVHQDMPTPAPSVAGKLRVARLTGTVDLDALAADIKRTLIPASPRKGEPLKTRDDLIDELIKALKEQNE